MFPDPGTHTHSLAVRPAHDAYRSMPGTPLGMDPRGHQSMDMAAAMTHARMSLEGGGDYFFPSINGPSGSKFPSGAIRPGSPFGPFQGTEFDPDGGYLGGTSSKGAFGCFPDRHHELFGKQNRDKDNKVAALLNGSILPPAKYAQVHPWRCEDGSYPSDFKAPKTVETMKVLDNSQLDRIMQAYRLPLDLRSINSNSHYPRDSTSSSRVRQAKLHSLWEFLGAYRLLEYERVKKNLQY